MSAAEERTAQAGCGLTGPDVAAGDAVEPDVVELAAREFGEQGREQADEALAQGQGDLWLDLLVIDEPSDAATSVDVDEAGW